jgi:DNA-directed RNA polymerase III subunit RPC1
MEDFSVAYDDTVRGSGGILLQVNYGDDGLDPSFMEDNGQPVDFDRLLSTVRVRSANVHCGLVRRVVNP